MLVDKSAAKIVDTVKATGAKVNGPIPLPTTKKIFTVNRSTFVNKKSREQFELAAYCRLLDIDDSNAICRTCSSGVSATHFCRTGSKTSCCAPFSRILRVYAIFFLFIIDALYRPCRGLGKNERLPSTELWSLPGPIACCLLP